MINKEDITKLKKEIDRLKEENKQLRKVIINECGLDPDGYFHGGAHQMFFEELTEVNDILEETKDQSILLPRNFGGSDD